MAKNNSINPTSIYEMVAELGFRKYFHFGGLIATQKLIDLIPFDGTMTVLEVGCASGKTACFLAHKFGCCVTGVDMLPGMVDRANERSRREGVSGLVEFRVGDAQELPFEANSFDVVMGEFITGLLPNKKKGLQEYSRVAKPGAIIGFNEATWIKYPPPDGLDGYLKNTVGLQGEILTSDGWRSAFEEAGITGLTFESHQVTSLTNPKDDLADILRALPKMTLMVITNPTFRKFIKMSASIPSHLLDYFGYGLYVGRKS